MLISFDFYHSRLDEHHYFLWISLVSLLLNLCIVSWLMQYIYIIWTVDFSCLLYKIHECKLALSNKMMVATCNMNTEPWPMLPNNHVTLLIVLDWWLWNLQQTLIEFMHPMERKSLPSLTIKICQKCLSHVPNYSNRIRTISLHFFQLET
jgi:hypothetical protein